MPGHDPNQPADLGAIVRFAEGVDQPIDQSMDEIVARLNELRRNGDASMLEASCLGHRVVINPSLITTIVAP